MNLFKSPARLVAAMAAPLALAGLFAATTATTPMAPMTYKVDTKQSKIGWTGKKVTGEHSGTINFRDGNLIMDGTRITGGQFIVDMRSMTNDDIKDEETRGKLLGHLHSDDFFSTEKHPTATYVVTGSKPTGPNSYDVMGKMTIKGNTQDLTIPVTVTTKGREAMAKGTASIDRTKYDVKYGSGSFFQGLGDKVIYDDFTLTFDVVARR